MLIAIYIISAFFTGFLFSVVTSMLFVFGIEQTGGDPGTPAIMLVSFMCICGVLGILTAAIMGTAKTKYQKEFPAKFSAIIFLFMYLPFHIIGLYFTDVQWDFLAIPLNIMLFFSYIPFFHTTAQTLTNVYEFVKRKEHEGKQHIKFFVFGLIGLVAFFFGWLIFKPETKPTPYVLSLEDNWALLASGGYEWQNDAYLNSVSFDVNGRMPYKISATYLSKSTPDEIYSININGNGKITAKEIREFDPFSWRENAKLPIKREDWTIGSIQAWNMFLENEGISACLVSSDKSITIFMDLNRIGTGKLAWELSIWNCSVEGADTSTGISSDFYLDAKTGETIKSYFE